MDERQRKERQNERLFVIVVLLLIIFVIIIFLLIKNLGFIDHKPLVPTGNVDIFDIVLNGDCGDCECWKPEDDEGSVTVFDGDVIYSNNTQLNIFTRTAYEVVDGKIAPGGENSYQFIIRNNNTFNIMYSLTLIETNDYNINMKYRLKKNERYVSGDDDTWVTYDELKQDFQNLSSKNYDVYTLDWKWFESENDTQIGTDINSRYDLKIKISAVEYEY